MTDTVDQTLKIEPESPRALYPDVGVPMDRFVLELLAKDPADRLQSASDAVRRLESLASGAVHLWRPVLTAQEAGDTRDRPESRLASADRLVERGGGGSESAE